MSGAQDGRAFGSDSGRGQTPAGFGEYCAARHRFFECLRVDSEIRRLESAWQQATRGGPRDGGGPAARDWGTPSG
jgi:hypothetical protein